MNTLPASEHFSSPPRTDHDFTRLNSYQKTRGFVYHSRHSYTGRWVGVDDRLANGYGPIDKGRYCQSG